MPFISEWFSSLEIVGYVTPAFPLQGRHWSLSFTDTEPNTIKTYSNKDKMANKVKNNKCGAEEDTDTKRNFATFI